MAMDPDPLEGVDPQGPVMFSPAWSRQPSRTPSQRTLGAPLAFSGLNYWVFRVAGTKKVSSRPRPMGFCFKYVSALWERQRAEATSRKTRLLHRKKECVQLKLELSPADG